MDDKWVISIDISIHLHYFWQIVSVAVGAPGTEYHNGLVIGYDDLEGPCIGNKQWKSHCSGFKVIAEFMLQGC
jgi:hypothetical protein